MRLIISFLFQFIGTPRSKHKKIWNRDYMVVVAEVCVQFIFYSVMYIMKKEISWKELIKKVSLEQQGKGVFNGLKGVFGIAKQEWEKIKSGKHELYSVKKEEKHDSSSKSKKSSKSAIKNKTIKNKGEKKLVLCDKCKLCDACIKRNKIILA